MATLAHTLCCPSCARRPDTELNLCFTSLGGTAWQDTAGTDLVLTQEKATLVTHTAQFYWAQSG